MRSDCSHTLPERFFGWVDCLYQVIVVSTCSQARYDTEAEQINDHNDASNGASHRVYTRSTAFQQRQIEITFEYDRLYCIRIRRVSDQRL